MTLPTGYDYQEAVKRLHRENNKLIMENAALQSKLDLMTDTMTVQRNRIERLISRQAQQPDRLNTLARNVTAALTGDLIVTEIDLIPANKLHQDG